MSSNMHTLTQHRDIQKWVSGQGGQPAIARERDDTGDVKSRLCLSFQRRPRAPSASLNQDDGMSPCSWSAWLAELDRQRLALKVAGAKRPSFEFVPRGEVH